MELLNKTIIVTGASGGIGESAARLFAHEGANVVLGARRGVELDRVASDIVANDGTALAIAGDLNDESYAKQLVDAAESSYGSLDGAFNNAAIIGEVISVPEMSLENWQAVIETNLTSAFLCTKYQIPALLRAGEGSIVLTSSFVGYSNAGLPGFGAYAASKAGMIGLTQSLAAEYGDAKIRVNALLPGGTRTAMSGDDPEIHDFIASLHPLRRMAEPEEIAQAAMFLLSSKASFITGSAVLADGGVSCQLG